MNLDTMKEILSQVILSQSQPSRRRPWLKSFKTIKLDELYDVADLGLLSFGKGLGMRC